MSFSYFFQCFNQHQERWYFEKHQDRRTASSISSWSVKQDHQDVEQA